MLGQTMPIEKRTLEICLCVHAKTHVLGGGTLFCNSSLLNFAKDELSDHDSENCSVIRRVTWLMICPKSSRLLTLMCFIIFRIFCVTLFTFLQFRKRWIVWSWFWKPFWYEEGDVVHNLPKNFNIFEFDVFHSALICAYIQYIVPQCMSSIQFALVYLSTTLIWQYQSHTWNLYQ